VRWRGAAARFVYLSLQMGLAEALEYFDGAISPFQAALRLTVLETAADYGAKTQNTALTFAGYNGMALYLKHYMLKNSLILTNIYWNAMTNITDTLIGLYTGERITRTQWSGLLITMLGMYLLQGDPVDAALPPAQ